MIQILGLLTLIKSIRLSPLSTDQYLTHYWPIVKGTMKDVIGSANMIQGNLTSFSSNRFGCPNSALALNTGWTQVPPGVYFNTPQFTISVWVYPSNVGDDARVFDFGYGQLVDSIILSLSFGNSLKPYLTIFSGSTLEFTVISSQNLVLNQWQFLVVTFDGTNVQIYLNGVVTAGNSNQNTLLTTKSRSKCYIGKSNWDSQGFSDSYLDDLRFYNQSLTQSDILEILMSQNKPS